MTGNPAERDFVPSQPNARQKDFHPGYSAVLIQKEVKDLLKDFRLERWGSASQMERCLVTAAVRLLLEEKELLDKWLVMFEKVAKRDLELTLSSTTHMFRSRG